MAVANTWATGHSAFPIHQLRPPVSNSSSSISPDTKISSSHIKKFSTCNFPRYKFSQRNSNNSRRIFCLCSKSNDNSVESAGFSISSDGVSSSASDWDWNRWIRYFSEIEQAESYTSVLKFQLEDAIEKEDFEEAAKLKETILEATSKDTVADIMSKLKDAIEQERYHDASRICQNTGSGLVGWWVGYSKDSEDPFGRIVRVTPGMGRFVGRSYTPRQLATGSSGTPLFEIFVVKDADLTYSIQVVFLQRIKGNAASSGASGSKSMKKVSAAEIEKASAIDIHIGLNGKEADKSEEALEERMRSAINFLMEKIPDLKINVMRGTVSEGATEGDDSVDQFMDEDKEISTSEENAEEETSDLEDLHPEKVTAEGDNTTAEGGKELETKLFIGGVIHNKEEEPSKDEYVRVPAEIKDIEKDSFILRIPKKDQDKESNEDIASKIKVAAVASQGVSELMPPEVANAFWNSDKISAKVAKDVREIVKLAISQAQKRNRFSEYTNFSRITTSSGDLDPFDGLYIGAFGPYGAEVVQLKRKFGNWKASTDENSSDMEFFEYVEAVKLTGDLNVPAGQVTFRARIGKSSRLSNRGMYPDDLGVVASYHGQGRIAEFGFRNPKWVKGELMQLNGKGISLYVNGADLGFLFQVPEQSFLVLFKRLKLPA